MMGVSVAQLVALIAGIIAILLIRKKYRKFSAIELAFIIVLWVVLVLLFTESFINLVDKILT